MGVIGFGNPSKDGGYDEFFGAERWDSLIDQFRQEHARVYKVITFEEPITYMRIAAVALKYNQLKGYKN